MPCSMRGRRTATGVRDVREVIGTRTRDEWLARFAGVDVCLTPVYSLDEVVAIPT